MPTPEGRLPTPEEPEPDHPHTDENQGRPAWVEQAMADGTMARPLTEADWYDDAGNLIDPFGLSERGTPEYEARVKAARERREAEEDEERRARRRAKGNTGRPAWVEQAMADGTMARPLTDFDFDDKGRIIYPHTGQNGETVDPACEQDPNQS